MPCLLYLVLPFSVRDLQVKMNVIRRVLLLTYYYRTEELKRAHVADDIQCHLKIPQDIKTE